MKNAPLITSIEQAKNFLNTNKDLGVKYEITSVVDKYEFIKRTKWSIKCSSLNISERHHVLGLVKIRKFFSKLMLSHR